MQHHPYITMCPNCSARLPITEEQMHRAHGKVRCANCSTVFYAPDQLLKGFYQKSSDDRSDEGILFLPDEPQPAQVRPDFSESVPDQRPQSGRDASPGSQGEVARQSASRRPEPDPYVQQQSVDALPQQEESLYAREPEQPVQLASTRFSRRRADPYTMAEEDTIRASSGVIWWLGSVLMVITITFSTLAVGFTEW